MGQYTEAKVFKETTKQKQSNPEFKCFRFGTATNENIIFKGIKLGYDLYRSVTQIPVGTAFTRQRLLKKPLETMSVDVISSS